MKVVWQGRLAESDGAPAATEPRQGLLWTAAPYHDDAPAIRTEAELAGALEHLEYAIFRRYHQELYRYCRAILSNPDDAQDALQSTMAAALRALPGEQREISLRAWLYRVAHNEAISILRRRQQTLDPNQIEQLRTPAAEAEADSRERMRRLVIDLRTLPERQRSALVMRASR